LIKASDRSLAAHYEYDPYGNAIAASGPYSAANPWRFSTKWHDTELPGNVLIYYGYRYYNPRLGRWMNWDPIEERGGVNLYGFVQNAPSINIDPTGTTICGVITCECPHGNKNVVVHGDSWLVVPIGAACITYPWGIYCKAPCSDTSLYGHECCHLCDFRQCPLTGGWGPKYIIGAIFDDCYSNPVPWH